MGGLLQGSLFPNTTWPRLAWEGKYSTPEILIKVVTSEICLSSSPYSLPLIASRFWYQKQLRKIWVASLMQVLPSYSTLTSKVLSVWNENSNKRSFPTLWNLHCDDSAGEAVFLKCGFGCWEAWLCIAEENFLLDIVSFQLCPPGSPISCPL